VTSALANPAVGASGGMAPAVNHTNSHAAAVHLAHHLQQHNLHRQQQFGGHPQPQLSVNSNSDLPNSQSNLMTTPSGASQHQPNLLQHLPHLLPPPPTTIAGRHPGGAGATVVAGAQYQMHQSEAFPTSPAYFHHNSHPLHNSSAVGLAVVPGSVGEGGGGVGHSHSSSITTRKPDPASTGDNTTVIVVGNSNTTPPPTTTCPLPHSGAVVGSVLPSANSSSRNNGTAHAVSASEYFIAKPAPVAVAMTQPQHLPLSQPQQMPFPPANPQLHHTPTPPRTLSPPFPAGLLPPPPPAQHHLHHSLREASGGSGVYDCPPTSSLPPPPTTSTSHQTAVATGGATAAVSLLGGKYLLVEEMEGQAIHRCLHIETNEEFVCKVMNRDAACQRLLTAHYMVDGHPNINTIQEVVVGKDHVYLVLPACAGGDLHSYVRARRRLREAVARHLFRQVVAAVHEAHTHGIVLRDLKLRKFVFTDESRSELKLESLEDGVVLESPDDDVLSDKHGCPAYVSPEILKSNTRYSGRAADMWGLGVMLYTMLVGRYPFHGAEHSGLFAKIRRGQFNLPDSLSSRAKCLIRCLLRKDPSDRLTTEDVLVHPWLTGTHRERGTLTAAVSRRHSPHNHHHSHHHYHHHHHHGSADSMDHCVPELPTGPPGALAATESKFGKVFRTAATATNSSGGSTNSTDVTSNTTTTATPSAVGGMHGGPGIMSVVSAHYQR